MYSYTSVYSSILPTGTPVASVCSSKWCGLHLCLFSLLELQGRAGHREGVQVLSCQRLGTAPKQWRSMRGGGRAQLSGWFWDGRGRSTCDVPWGLVRVWTLGQSSRVADHSSVFPAGVVYTCAYVICWGCGKRLATGRMFRCMELGGRVGRGGTESSG